MTRQNKLAKIEGQFDEVRSIVERMAVKLFLTAALLVGLWTLAKHLL